MPLVALSPPRATVRSMPEHLFDQPGPFYDDAPVRSCMQCRALVTFAGQPGWTTRQACGVRQYLTEPASPTRPAGKGVMVKATRRAPPYPFGR
jgi:hypothetical protein